ncbi:universal stress protein [Kitasatospora sp. NPDC048343]|uniref:universal stress protein n=1 Tax=Kitasatospora sp. NPDC048343 TaxID=3154717 RepID=UPI00340994BF
MDSEPAATGIVRYAAREAELRCAALCLFHSVDPALLAPGRTKPEQAEQMAASVLAPYARLIRSEFPQLTVREESVLGRPAAELVERSGDCSLIVLGHRGRGGFPRLPLGSVALQTATHARCPVIVVRALPSAPGGPVAVGFALPDDSRTALHFAAEEAALRGRPLEIVHADYRPQTLTLGLAPRAQTDQAGVVRAEHHVLEGEAALLRARHPSLRTAVRIEHRYPVPTLPGCGRTRGGVVGRAGERGRVEHAAAPVAGQEAGSAGRRSRPAARMREPRPRHRLEINRQRGECAMNPEGFHEATVKFTDQGVITATSEVIDDA